MCNGLGCEDTDNADRCHDGVLRLTGCPKTLIPADVWDVIREAGMYKRGLPPIAGGTLDQAAGFTEAARFIWAEQDRMKADAMSKV